MADFNPYYVWLSIPPNEQPPNHYRLLGIPLYEANPDVIESAADRQMQHLRTFQSGTHGVDSQRLLNEVSKAKICLLNPTQKQAYDQQLRSKLAPPPPAPVVETSLPRAPVAPPAASFPAAAERFPMGAASPVAFSRGGAKKSSPFGGGWVVLALSLAAVALIVLAARAAKTSGTRPIPATVIAPSDTGSHVEPADRSPLPDSTPAAEPAAEPLAGAWGAELLKNGSAEEPMAAGAIPGWYTIRGKWSAQPATRDNRIPDGQRCFYAGNSPAAELFQDVDVSGLAAGIDAGTARMQFSALTYSYHQKPPDTWRVVIEFRSANTTVLDSHDTQERSSVGRWDDLKFEQLVPRETRSLRVKLLVRRYGKNTKSNDAKFDALSLRLVKEP